MTTMHGEPTCRTGRRSFLARHPLVAYFVLAFAGFWGLQLPLVLSQDGFGLLPYSVPEVPAVLLFVVSVYAGPALAAVVVTAAERGRAGLRAFFRRFIQWRAGLRWYLVVLLGYPLLYLLAAVLVQGAPPLEAVAARWTLLFTAYLPALLLNQGITQWGEEPGWRGFALPRLQALLGPVPGSLLLGLLHALWHLPVYIYRGGPVALGPFDATEFAVFVALIAGTTIIWTWVYNNTGGSILLAVLLHSSFNAAMPLIDQVIPAYPDAAIKALYVAYIAIPLLLVVVTRGRLSYRGLPSRATEATHHTGAMGPVHPPLV